MRLLIKISPTACPGCIPGMKKGHLLAFDPFGGAIHKNLVPTFWFAVFVFLMRWGTFENIAIICAPCAVYFHHGVRCQSPMWRGVRQLHRAVPGPIVGW